MRLAYYWVFVASLCSILLFSNYSLVWAVGSCGKGGRSGEQSVSYNGSTYLIHVPPSYAETTAIPLLLALHGDEGTPKSIDITWGTVWAKSKNFILVAPQAPIHPWRSSLESNAAWLDGLLNKISSEYNIDLDRIWITGWSGGSFFLGYYALKKQGTYAAVFYMTGGQNYGYFQPPSSNCKIPARFTVGTNDQIAYTPAKGLYAALLQAGHEAVFVELPNETHALSSEVINRVVQDAWPWLNRYTLCKTTRSQSCVNDPPSTPDKGVKPLAKDLGTSAQKREATVGKYDRGAWKSDARNSTSEEEPDETNNSKTPQIITQTGGCTCSVMAGDFSASQAIILFLLAIFALVLRNSSDYHA